MKLQSIIYQQLLKLLIMFLNPKTKRRKRKNPSIWEETSSRSSSTLMKVTPWTGLPQLSEDSLQEAATLKFGFTSQQMKAAQTSFRRASQLCKAIANQ